MTTLAGVDIRAYNAGSPELHIITPYVFPAEKFEGCSYGESHCGYDIRLASEVRLEAGFMTLGVSLEHFTMPNTLCAEVKDKSTLRRMGIKVGNTIIEPGWRGHLTLEIGYDPLKFSNTDKIRYRPRTALRLKAGQPIAQIVFHPLSQPVEGYRGKYQDQTCVPWQAVLDV